MNEKGDKQNAGQTDHFGRYPAVSDFVQAISREYGTYASRPDWASVDSSTCECLGIQKTPQGISWEVAGETNYKVSSMTVQAKESYGPINHELVTALRDDFDGNTFEFIRHIVRMLVLVHRRLDSQCKLLSFDDPEFWNRRTQVRKLLTQLVDSTVPLIYDEEFVRRLQDPSGFDDLLAFLIVMGDALALDIGYGGLFSSEENIIREFSGYKSIIRRKT